MVVENQVDVKRGGHRLAPFDVGPAGYGLVLRAAGTAAVSPPPFAELARIPELLSP